MLTRAPVARRRMLSRGCSSSASSTRSLSVSTTCCRHSGSPAIPSTPAAARALGRSRPAHAEGRVGVVGRVRARAGVRVRVCARASACLLLHEGDASDACEVGEGAEHILHGRGVALRRPRPRQSDGLWDGARRLSQAAQQRRLVLAHHVRQKVGEGIESLGRGASVEARQALLQLRSGVHA
eukprot:scaffold54678_cov49-Phaeocystis_antarctica.AAC.2